MHTKQKAFSYILFPLFSAGDGIPAFSFCINRQKFLFSQKQRAANIFYIILINFHLLFHLHESTMPNRIKHCFIKFIFFLSQFIFQQFLCLALNPLQSIIHRLGAFSEKLCDFPVIRSHQVQFQHMILQRT